MTRLVYGSFLLPFGLLVWRPDWTSVAALGLWTVLGLALVAYSLLQGWFDGRAQRATVETATSIKAIEEELLAFAKRLSRVEETAEGLVNARGTQKAAPRL